MENGNNIQRLTAEAVRLLKGMIAIPSPSFSEGEVCSYICNWMSDKGIVHERVGNNIIARLSDQKTGAQSEKVTSCDGMAATATAETSAISPTPSATAPSSDTTPASAAPTLMLCAHIDTVSPCEGYSFDPYTPDYAKAAEAIGCGDIIAGLGSNDDGASVVSMIAVLRYFVERSLDCARDDKEEARNDKEEARDDKEGARDDREGTTDGPAKNILLVLSCEEERSGVNGMTGLWGSVLCSSKHARPDSCTNTGTDTCTKVDYAIVGEPTGMRAATAERGLLVIDATAHGVSGHAARNEGVNAIDIALQDILAIKNHEFSRISPRMGKVNLNVTQINAGTAHNVIPDTCTFVIDIRPTEQYTNEEILSELQAICKSELKPRNLSNRSSATHENSPLQKAAEALGIETFSSPTTSDWMRIDCDAIKMGPGDSARSHRKDEFVYTSEIENAISTYIRFIETL